MQLDNAGSEETQEPPLTFREFVSLLIGGFAVWGLIFVAALVVFSLERL